MYYIHGLNLTTNYSFKFYFLYFRQETKLDKKAEKAFSLSFFKKDDSLSLIKRKFLRHSSNIFYTYFFLIYICSLF
ncbi:hypothetical protein BFP77_11780 [Maribacter sp. 4U21]|nr:hypothetical protein BFP77_11780 [Maribacter sp. 4U21]